jgi:hypothetical protein
VNLWAKAGYALIEMFEGNDVTLGPNGVLKAIPSAESVLLKNCGFILPSGLKLRYDDMKIEEGSAVRNSPIRRVMAEQKYMAVR